MPAALPLVAGAFLAAGSIATAVGLTTAFVVAGLAISWAAVLTITGVALLAVAYLARKTPKPDSGGQQLKQKLDPQAPVPVLYGRSATGGFITWRGTWGSKNAFYGIVTVLSAGGPIAGIESYKAGDYPIGFGGSPAYSLATVNNVGGYSGSSKLYKGKLAQRWQNGAAPANTTPGGATGLPIPAGAMSGLAHVVTRYEFSNDAFPQGLPSSLWTASGVKLYDPRQDSTYPGGSGAHRVDQPATWTYSENPFLAALQWALGRYENGRRVYGIGAKWAEVDVASFVTGANVADANGWKVGGVVTTDDDKYAVLASLLAAGGGVPVARGAQIACTVNAPKTSVLTLTKEDIVGEVETSSTTSWRDRQNTIIPKYREESQGWEIIAGEQISSAQYISEDGGEQKTVEVEFPLVQQAAQAHQLATYELCNSREFLTFTVNAKLRLLAVRVGDAITVNVPQIAAKNIKCTITGREFNPSDMSVTLSLKSETDAKHAFALGQSQVAPPAPKLDGYDPSNPGAPAANAWAITATQISKDETTLPVIVVTGATDDPNTSTVIVEYRPTGSDTWLNYGEFPRTTTKVEISGLTDQTAYDVALSYRTVLGVVGERLVLNATAGAFTVSWSDTVTGANKPADNATVGAPVGTEVGGRPVTQLIGDVDNAKGNAQTAVDALKNNAGVIVKVTDLLTTISTGDAKALADAKSQLAGDIAAAKAEGTTARSEVTKARTDLGVDIAAAKKAGTDASAEAGVIRTDLANEVKRAKDDTAAIRTVTTQLQTDTSGNTTVITNEQTTRANADSALSNRAGALESVVNSTTDGNAALKARIGAEETTRTNADSALATRATNLETTVNGVNGGKSLNTKISDEATARTNADSALATRATNLETTVNGVNGGKSLDAKISDEATTRTNADSALATRATNLEARSTGGGNLLANTDFANLNSAGWKFSADGAAATYEQMGVNTPNNDWHPYNENALGVRQVGSVGSGDPIAVWASSRFAVTAGQWLQFYAFVASHRSNGYETNLVFFNASDTGVGFAWSGRVSAIKSGGVDLGNWQQLGVQSTQVPTGAVSAELQVRKFDTASGQSDSWLWFTRPYVGLARQGQTEWNPYAPGSSLPVIVSTNARITDEATARANADSALATRATNLETTVNSGTNGNAALKSRIETEETTRATAISTEATNRTNLASTLRGEIAAVGSTPLKAINTGVTLVNDGGYLNAVSGGFNQGIATLYSLKGAQRATFRVPVGIHAHFYLSTDNTGTTSTGGFFGIGFGFYNGNFYETKTAGAADFEMQGGHGGSLNDAWAINYTGTTVELEVNGSLRRSVTVSPNAVLYFKAMLNTNHQIRNMKVVPLTDRGVINASVNEEATTRTNADSALAGRATALEATVNTGANRNAALRSDITSEATARTNADSALATRATALETRATQTPVSFYAVSRGLNGTSLSGRDVGVYKADGTQIAGGQRGYRVCVFDSSNNITAQNTYDTLGDNTASNRMKFYLDGLANGLAVVIITGDEPQGQRLIDPNLSVALQRCGAGDLFASSSFAYRAAYMLIGRVGIGKGNGLEVLKGTGDSATDAFIEQRFDLLNGVPQLTNGGAIVATNARIGAEETARANGDSALSTRTGTLESNYSGVRNDLNNWNNDRYNDFTRVNARVATEESTRASADSALATRATVLETSAASTGSYLNANPNFSLWSDPNGLPNGYVWWQSNGTIRRYQRNASEGGGWFPNFATTGGELGIYNQAVYFGAGVYVVEADVVLDSGSWIGSGVTLSGIHNLDFSTWADTNGYTGSDGNVHRRKFTKLFTVGEGAWNVHPMVQWNTLGQGGAKTMTFLFCGIRPASAGEILAQKADATLNNPGGVVARITAEESTRATAISALATRATTLEARTVGGGNLLKNSDFDYGSGWDTWNTYSNVDRGINGPDATWFVPGINSLWIRGTGGDFGYYTNPDTQVAGGRLYEASCDVGAHRTNCHIAMEWYNRDGGRIGDTPTTAWQAVGCGGNVLGTRTDAAYTWGGRPGGWTRIAVRGQAPVNAMWGRMVVRGQGVLEGSDCYVWMSRPMLAEVSSLTGDPLPYSPGGKGKNLDNTARITTTETTVANINGKTQAYFSKSASVPGAEAFIVANAVNDQGQATSNVSLGASAINLYNVQDGSAKLALSLQGGTAVFSGNISAKSGITIGTGTLKVAIAPTDYPVSDGQVVSFGYDLGRAPSITFGQCPVAINSGEVYQPYAESLTGTGFTARLRIISAPVSSSQSIGAMGQSGSGPQWQGSKSGKPNASNGAYTFSIGGTIDAYAYGDNGDLR